MIAMNLKCILKLMLAACLCSPAFGQDGTKALSPDITSITVNWTWQVQNGDTTTRDFCLLEFALPAETLADACCFKLEGVTVTDGQGRAYQSSAFVATAGEQSLHRDYRLVEQKQGDDPNLRFRVRIEDPKKDIEYFNLEGQLEVAVLSRDPSSIQEYNTLDWQSLYEALLPHDIRLVFAAQSRSMIEQMANLGSMSPEGQESLNNFLETYSMYLHEPLFPENTNLLLDDPNRQVLKIETLGPDGQPIPFKDRRMYAGGALHVEQQYEAPLSGREQVRITVATDKSRVNIPLRMERVVLPW